MDEEHFSALLPTHLQNKSAKFFTPVDVAKKAAEWLSGEDKRDVLDIGAGFGKFCMCGSWFTKSKFYGIEMRPHLVELGKKIILNLQLDRIQLDCVNILNTRFSHFNAFYMFNPFQENLVPFMSLDATVELSQSAYRNYVQHTWSELSSAAIGSKLVTFHMNNYDVPKCYKIENESERGHLKFWIKII